MLLLSCDVERNKYDINLFCKGIEAVKKENPENIEGDATFEECIESRVIVISKNSIQTPIFSGKVLSYHQVGDKGKITIRVEKYSSNKEMCGANKFIDLENIFEQTFYTIDEKAYLNFTTLKDCKL